MEAQRKKILFVDDNVELLNLLSEFFSRYHFDIDTAETSYQARTLLREKRFDIIILDLQLGRGEKGSTLCQQIRKISDIPVLMLTNTKNDDEMVKCFRVGIDDYVTKPCRHDVLLLRVQAILNRTAPKNKGACVYHFLNWSFNPQSATLINPKGEKVSLTDNLSDLLLTFLEHPQETLTRDQLINITQGRSLYDPFERTIDIQLCRLRRKLKESEKSPQLIRTIRGQGYVFLPQVKRIPTS